VIFVHELGHFAVAKLCGVKSEKFYIGFDIGGWKLFKYQWGETEYGIGALPLGGYVKMLGQEDNPARVAEELERAKVAGESGEEGFKLDPRSYLAQSVPERMAIISAGVIMNVIFAFVFASIAYSMGVEYTPCVIGSVLPGEAAWQAGLQPGDEVLKINDLVSPRFEDLQKSVALGDLEHGVRMEVRRAGASEPLTLVVHPQRKTDTYAPQIGARPSYTNHVNDQIAAFPGTAALGANPPFEPGDEIVAIDGQAVKSYLDIQAVLTRQRSKTLTFTVRRAAGQVDILVSPNPIKWFGIETQMGPVTAVQPASPAAEAGIKPGDTIEKIYGEPAGDPLSLPERLRKLAGQTIDIELKRAGTAEPVHVQLQPRDPPWDERSDRVGSPMAAPALGLTYNISSQVTSVAPGSSAEAAQIKAGDRIISARTIPQAKKIKVGKAELSPRSETYAFSDEKPDWPRFFFDVQELVPGTAVELELDGGRKVELVPLPTPGWFSARRGVALDSLTAIRTAQSFGEALKLGKDETVDSLLLVVRFLRKLGTQVSPLSMGGPGTIFVYAGASAEAGMSHFLIFLCMLSANLAVINFLPIPVLDGGHMVFLTYEAVRGKPVSERLFMAFTYAGFLFILTLMLFVVGLDVSRLVEWLKPS
jgi:regulator of sigma E protease